METRLNQIEALSEDFSKASIDALIELMNDETLTDDEFEFAEAAFEKVSFMYGMPQNEVEERDWKICILIAKRLNLLTELLYDSSQTEASLEDAKLESEIANNLLALASEDQKEDRSLEAELAESIIGFAQQDYVDIEKEIEEINAWIACARGMLMTEKYQELPEECLEVFFPGSEDEDEEEDDCDDCDGECTGACEMDEEVLEEGCGEEGGCCGGGNCK